MEEYVRDPEVGNVYCKKCVDAVSANKINALQIPDNGYGSTEVK